MTPKPKNMYVIQAGELPVAVFRDHPAAQEFMAGLCEESPEVVHALFTVRLYEYSVGPAKVGNGNPASMEPAFTLRSEAP